VGVAVVSQCDSAVGVLCCRVCCNVCSVQCVQCVVGGERETSERAALVFVWMELAVCE